jgi:glycine oxidase
MTNKDEEILIVGQGLAGTCLAWNLWDRGIPFRIVARGDQSGSSHVAAGMLTPVTGKTMNPSWRLEEFRTKALRFYRTLEHVLGEQFFYDVPILRVFGNGAEREKFESKREELTQWTGDVVEDAGLGVRGDFGGVKWHGGGWLKTHRFLTRSKGYFRERGLYGQMDVTREDLERMAGRRIVLCEGAAGLGEEKSFPYLPERRAKGEILTVRVPGLREDCIISGGGWLIPRGGSLFRAGSGYEWEALDRFPTPEGRERVEEIVRHLTGQPFEVLDHVAGVRPIVRRSQPVIGWHRDREGLAIFNGLGSKGVLYAPGVSKELALHLSEGKEIDEGLDVSKIDAPAKVG